MSKQKVPTNPYRPYDLKSGNLFYYEDVIDKIKEKLSDQPGGQIIILQGNPGVGKTSTLHQIENNPATLGEQYIPVYLDTKQLIGLDHVDLVFSMYREIVDKLSSKSFDITKPAHIKRQDPIEDSLSAFLLTIDSLLGENKVFFVIFDEADKFLKSSDYKVINAFFKLFLNMEKNWDKFVLLLACEQRLEHASKSKPLNEFLAKSHTIRVEDLIANINIRKLIEEPVIGNFTYSEEAIDEIIWLSGKNIYFQQLICYYIFKVMSDPVKLRCEKQQVRIAVNRILVDERPEFDYAWEHKISMEGRLIAAALADETVTEKKGDSDIYDIKENKLLERILEGKLEEEIKELCYLGYLNPVNRRRFTTFPFKIPLYGQWVRIKHPFLKTVFDHVDVLADKLDIKALADSLKENKKYKLISHDASDIVEIIEEWGQLANSIVNEGETISKKGMLRFLQSLARFLDLNVEGKPDSLVYSTLNIRNLDIGILEEAYCFFQKRPELVQEDLDNIERIATALAEGETQDKVTLLFYFKKSEKVERLVKKTFLGLVAVQDNDFKKIILSERPREAFRTFVLSRLSLQKISPYQDVGPVKATFYGRKNIIEKVTNSTRQSFAFVGARKIGKSSLLNKIMDDLPPNVISVYMDLDVEFFKETDYKSFLNTFKMKIKEVFNKKVVIGVTWTKPNISKLPQIIKKLAYKNREKRILFILDEIDNLLEVDKSHGYKLMKIFRTLVMNNTCQFIFSGFKGLYHQKRSIESPSYNFYEEVRLSPLEKDAAIELISKPMKSIGIKYENDETKNRILEYTTGHPSLIQFFCKELVLKVEKHERVDDRRTIFKEDVEELFNSKYEGHLMDEVYTFNTDLAPLNRLILMLLAMDDTVKGEFSVDTIYNKLADAGVEVSMDELYYNIRNMVMRFILLDVGRDKYKFALPVFPDILKEWVNESRTKLLIKEIRENGKTAK